ncbi:MAG: polyprenyl synthetase family protein [Actinomycetes bacterium]
MNNPLDEANLRQRIQSELDTFVTSHTTYLTQISPDTVELVSSLTGLLQGGKRLRPAFAYWGYRSVGQPDSDELVRACASLEFLQACALIHDDVMDDSDTRRGKPATHKQFETMHHTAGWQGSSIGFGHGAAILIGDLALSWADEMLLTSGLSQDELNRAKSVYDIMRTELMAGQFLDLLEQARRGTSVASAQNVIRFKSAKYTIERPLHIGAAIANAKPEHIAALSAYGLALGEAFQLRDDVLGVFGDSETTGKPAGDDLREGKQTVLLALAMQRDDKAAQIDSLMTTKTMTAPMIEELQTLITSTGALEQVETMITAQTHTAIQALQIDSIDPHAREALTELAYVATQRSA